MSRHNGSARRRVAAMSLAALGLLSVACGDDGGSGSPVTLTLVTYDSFPKDGTSLNDALAAFSADTGITVDVVTAGDAGTMVTKAVLTAGNPEGDVMWGVDNTLLSAATEGDVFEGDPAEVDYGDVCVNYDIAWYTERSIQPPNDLADLTDPVYADQLVVENPSTSSPGLAFLLSTIAEFGDDGWEQYWTDLRANGVEVVDSWESAYYERFSGSAGSTGDRPLVVSYATSPPAEVIFADPPVEAAPTGVSSGTCFRQVEYAGILRGTEHEDAARKLLTFLTGETFQAELPLNLFVYPANPRVKLPDVFTRYAVLPDETYSMDPERIAENRQAWQEQWTEIVLR